MIRRSVVLLAATCLAVAGCGNDGGSGGGPDGSSGGDESGTAGGPPIGESVAYLSVTDHLIRASIGIRGVRPSVDDMRRVQDDPQALEELVDEYLETEAFGVTVRDIHNEALLVRAEIRPDLFYFNKLAELGLPDDITDTEVTLDVHEGPLRLVEHVVTHDLPYTEIVTADYLLVNEISSKVWGASYDDGGEPWQVSAWPDGRPAAGVLSSSVYFNRHKSMGTNYNRARANAISDALLCNDFLAADIPVDSSIDLSDEDAVKEAVKNNPACSACHANLDPLASFFFGHDSFHLSREFVSYPLALYNAEIEPAWRFTTETAPSFYGEPGTQLDDLGEMIADSPWFAECAARRFAGYLLQRRPNDVDTGYIDKLVVGFEDSGFNARTMVREIVLSDEFRKSHADADELAEDIVGYQRVRPRQLDRMVEDLTGFRWMIFGMRNQSPESVVMPDGTFGSIPALSTSFLGFEVLGGGIDSFYATEPSFTVNPTSTLVIEHVAGYAARFVVQRDFAVASPDRRLLTQVEVSDSGEAAVRDQLVGLHARILGEFLASDAEAIDESYALFAEVLGRTDDPSQAWRIILTAMLQDMRFIHF